MAGAKDRREAADTPAPVWRIRQARQIVIKVIDTPWAVAVGNDLRMPEAVGPRNAGVNFVNWYISKLHRAAHSDSDAALAFLRVANLLAPPPSIMHPKIAARVLLASLRPKRVSA